MAVLRTHSFMCWNLGDFWVYKFISMLPMLV